MKLTKKDKIQIAIWVGVLRSGVFTQTRGSLEDNQGHCCLGVACELFGDDEKKQFDFNGFLFGGIPNDQGGIPKWLNEINADFGKKTGKGLTNLNDDSELTFKQIANRIEKTYLKD